MVKKEEKKELKDITPYVRQILERKLGQFCNKEKGADRYFFYEAIQLLRSDVGEDIIRKAFGEKYNQVVKWLDKYGVALNHYKMYHDLLDQNAIDKYDDTNKFFVQYKRFQDKIPLCERLLFKIFLLFLNETKIQYFTIPQEIFKKEKREYRPFDYVSERVKRGGDVEEEKN